MVCGIIAHEAKRLPEYFNIAKLAFNYLPDEIKPQTKTDTKYMYEFTHRFDGHPLNSSVYVATDIRGGTVQRLHITESAFIKDRQKLKAGSKQAVPLTGWISEETTANGFNEFYDDYEFARNNKRPNDQDYRAYFYAWVEDPEYTLPGKIDEYLADELEVKRIAKEQYGIDITDGQLIWRRWKKDELRQKHIGAGLSGEQLFNQEYPLTWLIAFQSGAGNIFDAVKIDNIVPVDPMMVIPGLNWLAANYPNNQQIVEKYNALIKLGVWFWDLPNPGEKYIIGVDPSDGTGSDSGVIDVWNEKLVQVAQFYGKVLPDTLAEIAAQLGYFYNEAFIGVENNLLSTILFLSKIYSNYYFETRIDEKTAKRTKKIGWSTNTKTRDPLIDYSLFFLRMAN